MIFITGATGGIGKAFAVECASRGWDLFLTDMEAEGLAMLSGALAHTYEVTVLTQPCDLTDPASREGLFAALRERGLTFRGLVNVAGLEYEGPFRERRREEIRTIVRLNVEAAVEVTHALLERADPSVPFRIITVSSMAAFFPMPLKATYAASKRFLLDFFLALREELRGEGVTVTVLCPAGIPTTERAIRGIERQGLIGQLTTQDLGRVVARTVDHALKGDAVYIPGPLNRMLVRLGGLVPPALVARWIGMRWRSASRS